MEEESARWGWRAEGGWRVGADADVGKDKKCLEESYITLEFSPEPCVKINRRINDQISL